VHFQRDSQYPQVINTNKGQTQVQPEYYTPYNNTGHPVNPIRTTIVPTEGEYRHRQAQNKGLPPLGTTYQHQRPGNQNCKCMIFFHPAELPLLHWFCCYWLYYLCYSEFGLHFQQVEYSSIVGLMFDIHHFGFCSSGCLFFDADRSHQYKQGTNTSTA
jgi:hypothetical protein